MRCILPPLTDEQLDMFRNCWRVGDWRPIELEFGIVCPQYNLRGRTPEGGTGRCDRRCTPVDQHAG